MRAKHFHWTLRLICLLYVVFRVIVPYSHSHAEDAPAEKGLIRADSGTDLFPLFSARDCCELHETGHDDGDDHHIHFFIEDRYAGTRSLSDNTSSKLKACTAADTVQSNGGVQSCSNVVISPAIQPRMAYLREHSGLAPPC